MAYSCEICEPFRSAISNVFNDLIRQFSERMLMKNATEHLKSADLFTPQAEMRVFLLKSCHFRGVTSVTMCDLLSDPARAIPFQ